MIKVPKQPHFSPGNMISVRLVGDRHMVGLVLDVEKPEGTGNSFYVVKILTDSGEVMKTWISTLDQVEILC
jgi:hypothetical protein